MSRRGCGSRGSRAALSVEHPIAGDEQRAIKRYLATRTDKLPWLFISERQAQLTRQAVNYKRAYFASQAQFAAGRDTRTVGTSQDCGWAPVNLHLRRQ
jgi:hypothetical protein